MCLAVPGMILKVEEHPNNRVETQLRRSNTNDR